MSLNLAECLEISAEANPGKLALICEDSRMTYRELAGAAKRVANLLRDKGIGPGDKVALMLPNTPHFPIVYYGILYAGATAVPINMLLRRREILYQLDDSGAKAFFSWHETVEQAAKAFQEAEACAHFIVVEPALEPMPPPFGESFVRLAATASPKFDMAQTQPDDTAVILYTSALTGKLRGAELTHYNLFQNALTIRVFALHLRPDDVCMAVLPLFHSFGQTTMMNAPFLSQSTVLLVPRFEAGKVLELIQRERVTRLCMVPTMYHFLVTFKDDEKYDLSSIESLVTGGAAMPQELAERFEKRFGVTPLEGYGLTEASPVVSFNIKDANRPGSIGKPLWGCRAAILRDDGTRANPGEIGEIALRGHNVMKGYHNQPEATARVMRNGWFLTGDLGCIDSDGYLFITGLKKDMIIRAGMNVYPREIEDILQSHPAIEEAAVVGRPDPVRGQEVVAFIVYRSGMTLPEKELSAFCREQLASYKCPRKFEVVAALPKDKGGRVIKSALAHATQG